MNILLLHLIDHKTFSLLFYGSLPCYLGICYFDKWKRFVDIEIFGGDGHE